MSAHLHVSRNRWNRLSVKDTNSHFYLKPKWVFSILFLAVFAWVRLIKTDVDKRTSAERWKCKIHREHHYNPWHWDFRSNCDVSYRLSLFTLLSHILRRKRITFWHCRQQQSDIEDTLKTSHILDQHQRTVSLSRVSHHSRSCVSFHGTLLRRDASCFASRKGQKSRL